MTLRELEIKVKGTNIRRTEADLAKLEAQANKTAAAISSMGKAISGIPRAPSIGSLGGGGRGGGGGAASSGGGGGGVAGALGSMGGILSGTLGKLGSAASGAAGGFGSLVGGIGKAAGAAATGVTGLAQLALTATGVGAPIAALVGIVGGLVSGGLNLLGGAFEGLIKIGGQVVGVIGDIIGGIIETGVKAAETALSLTAMFAQQRFAEYVSYEQQVRGLAVYEDSAKSLMETLGRLRQLAKLPGLALPEVMKATVGLRAAGLGADTAEKSILGFARALGAVGKGKADFAGAMLALQQIVTAGKLEGDEIRQLSERVPQIRLVLMKAFGSAKGEEISKQMQKMGLSVVDVVKKINDELLKIPGTTSGVSTSLENVMDDMAEATRPVGQGLAMMFTAAMPGVNNFVQMIAEASRGIGEVLGTIGKSGIIGEIMTTLGNAVKSALNVDTIQDGLITALSYVGATIQQLPAIIKEAIDFVSNLFDVLKPKIIDFANTFVFWIEWAVMKVRHTFDNLGIMFKQTISLFSEIAKSMVKFQEGDFVGAAEAAAKAQLAFGYNDVFRAMSGQTAGELFANGASQVSEEAKLQARKQNGTVIQGLFGDLTAGMKGAGLTGVLNEFGKIEGVAGNFQKRIKEGLGPLPDLPDGLMYGGRPDESLIKPIGGASEAESSLKEIAANTKKSNDLLKLRTQTIGGGVQARIGVTATELSNENVYSFGTRTAPSLIEQGLKTFYASEARKRGPAFAFRR